MFFNYLRKHNNFIYFSYSITKWENWPNLKVKIIMLMLDLSNIVNRKTFTKIIIIIRNFARNNRCVSYWIWSSMISPCQRRLNRFILTAREIEHSTFMLTAQNLSVIEKSDKGLLIALILLFSMYLPIFPFLKNAHRMSLENLDWRQVLGKGRQN